MKRILIGWIVLAGSVFGLQIGATPAPSPWERSAAALADQIAEILGPGQAQLAIKNISSLPAAEVPAIRKLLEQDLKAHGVVASGSESANSIRITLSENQRERIWVAEVVEGKETRVAMVTVGAVAASVQHEDARIILRKERLIGGAGFVEPILFAAQAGTDFVVLHPENLAVGSLKDGEWKEQKRIPFPRRQNASRDPQGLVTLTGDARALTAFVPGIQCSGTREHGTLDTGIANDWSVQCHESDDPWPIAGGYGSTNLRAFFNSGRNFFTGVVTPAVGVDLPPFYSAALFPHPAGGAALLLAGVDGQMQMVDNGTLKSVSGTRDWGSDFAVLHSSCGAGVQVIVSSSGEAASDSLRAYEIPALEGLTASSPLNMDGAVTALWTSQDGKDVMAVVQNAAKNYEVDRVTALCN
jgi:hypothetical protein